jgi:predicted Ser/Thr protein kinase
MDRPETATVAQPPPTHRRDEPVRFLPGTLLAGRYRIVAPLGRGGMGEVYRAEDVKLGQPVALKFLPAGLRGDPDRRRRLLDEVKLARRVAHPAVCRVWDVGEVDGHDFLTMEYVDGEDLASLLRRVGRLPEDRAVQVARELCAGLAAVHEQGLIHRDLKPPNVMIDGRGRAKLADFGLAAFAEDVSGAEIRSGTPAYMAPEQLEGREATARSDIYALGLVLYEVFTGREAYPARSWEEARRRSDTRPTSPSSHVKDLDPAVERVIERCLEKDPAMRPSSALAVAVALPGGDPLAAALAAGETPSPEMVAAAGGSEGLQPLAVAGCLAAVAAGIALVAVLADRGTPAFDTLDKPPEVLEHEARQILAAASATAAPADRSRGFAWEKTAEGARELRFWYRESPRSLAEGRPFEERFLSLRNPPPVVPGMAGVQLSVHGTLQQYVRVPAGDEPAAGVPDFSPLLARAGFEARDLRPVEPTVLPPVFGDARAAWEARRGDKSTKVEAAAFHGRPVWLQVQPAPPTSEASNSPIIYLLIGLFALSVLFARRNLRRGRGDTEGARRLAALGAVSGFLGNGLLADPRFFLPPRVLAAVAISLFFVAFYTIAYLALEPLVRRLWPHALASWTRLLSGRLRDPLVGRDVLIGSVAGVGLALVDVGGGATDPAFLSFPWWQPDLLLGGWRVAGSVLRALVPSVLYVLVNLLCLALLRLLLRKTWLAAVVMVVFVASLSAGGGFASPHAAAVGLANGLLLVGMLVGRGLLAAIVLVAVDSVLVTSVLTTRLTAWYADSAVVAILVALTFAAWGAWAALERRPVEGGRSG